MLPSKTITLTTSNLDGIETKVSLDISTIKKIIERLEGSRLYIQRDSDETQAQLDVTETAEEVKNLIIQAK
jgi:hypothetical protein